LVSIPTPHILGGPQKLGAAHLFEDIEGTTFERLIENIGLANSSFYKTFLIKKFGAISNIIITIEMSYFEQVPYLIEILFTENGITYTMHVHRANLRNSFGRMEFPTHLPLKDKVELSIPQLKEFAARIIPETALESFSKNPSLASLFDILAADLKKTAGIESTSIEVEPKEKEAKQLGLGELLLRGREKRTKPATK